MNRKQRRAKGIKKSEPAYMVKQSEISSHIDRFLKSDPNIQKAIQEEVQKNTLAEIKEQEIDIQALFLLAVRRSEKLGKKRLLRVARTLIELMKHYEERYEDCDRYAMRLHLKEEVDIDVEHLEEEIERYAEK